MQSYRNNFTLFVKGPDRIETFHINADEIKIEEDGWYFIGARYPIARFNIEHVIGYSLVPVFEQTEDGEIQR
ncbi:MAG: hypothetical protein CL946_10575 [Ectothiorhodospiraceae bacterium]|nr:hypothetical protein [Ectothiorhodospiraceae bacterium]